MDGGWDSRMVAGKDWNHVVHEEPDVRMEKRAAILDHSWAQLRINRKMSVC